MTGRLNIGSQAVTEPSAVLNSPGLAIVYFGEAGRNAWLSFTTPVSAREVAAACEAAAKLLEGGQVAEA